MKLIVETTNLKQKGFITLFKTHKFTLSIHDQPESEPIIDPIKLKAKVAFVGFTTTIPNYGKLYIKIKAENENNTTEIEVRKGNHEIKINNSKFRGVIALKIIENCFFTELENEHLIKKGLTPVEQISRSTGASNNKMDERMCYDKRLYYVELFRLRTTWQKSDIFYDEPLPLGWQKKFTNYKKPYYINHNKNITQWEHPNCKTYIKDLENKIHQYRILSEEANLFHFFDFTKFKITVDRKFMVQSTASLFLKATKDHLLRQPFVVFYGEIGEDYGGLVKEFYYDASLEISRDVRIKSLGNVFDVYSSEELKHNGFINVNQKSIVDIKYNEPEEVQVIDANMIEATIITEVDPIGNIRERTVYTTQTPVPVNIISESYNPNDPWFKEENHGTNKLSDKDFYTYLGVFLGHAFEHEINIAVDFSLAFYENLLERKYDINLIQDVELQSNFNFILKNNMDEIYTEDYFGDKLTEENKKDLINKNIQYLLFEQKKETYDLIRAGFHKVAVTKIEQIFTARDLSRIFSGKEDLTLQLLQESVAYFNCDVTSLEITLFWKVLSKKDEVFYRKLLHFITGSASLPISGLKTNKFKWFIEIVEDEKTLIRASTCLNKLFLGRYYTEEEMEMKLMFSIDNTEGFHKV